jgi:hypothetical protein
MFTCSYSKSCHKFAAWLPLDDMAWHHNALLTAAAVVKHQISSCHGDNDVCYLAKQTSRSSHFNSSDLNAVASVDCSGASEVRIVEVHSSRGHGSGFFDLAFGDINWCLRDLVTLLADATPLLDAIPIGVCISGRTQTTAQVTKFLLFDMCKEMTTPCALLDLLAEIDT